MVARRNLKAGNISFTSNGKKLLIASISTSHKSETVYNFTVKDNHTYYVGDDGVLVHNQSSSRAYSSATSTTGSTVVSETSDSLGENILEGIAHITWGLPGTLIGAGVTALNLTVGNLVAGISRLIPSVRTLNPARISFSGPAGENDIISSYGGLLDFGKRGSTAFTIGPFVNYVGENAMEDVPSNTLKYPVIEPSRFKGEENLTLTQHERGHVRQNMLLGPLTLPMGIFMSMLPQAFDADRSSQTFEFDRNADKLGINP